MIVSLVLTGCGEGRRHLDIRELQRVAPVVTSSQPPAAFALADMDCQTQTPGTSVTSATIWSWNGPRVEKLRVPLQATFAGGAVTPAVAKITYQDSFGRLCDASQPGGLNCLGPDGKGERWLQRSAGQPLHLCQNSADYGRQSYETVAAASLYFIQNAYDYYLAAVGDPDSASSPTHAPVQRPAPVALMVLPEFTTDFTHIKKNGVETTVRTYLTDNLAYFPGSGLIGVFPIKASEKPNLAGYFWESAFVLGHEYGHHIDFSRHGQVLASVGLRWEPLTHSYSDEWAAAAGASPASDRALVTGAEAEAFADLLGYYAAGGDGKAVAGVPYIGFDRNVRNSHFRGGEPKILSAATFAMLLGQTANRKGGENYADIHTIGAILAYSLDQVFATVTGKNAEPTSSTGSKAAVLKRYQLALNFMDALVKNTAQLPAEASGASVLDPLGAALTTATESAAAGLQLQADAEAQVKQQVCMTTRRLLPAVAAVPFAAGGSC